MKAGRCHGGRGSRTAHTALQTRGRGEGRRPRRHNGGILSGVKIRAQGQNKASDMEVSVPPFILQMTEAA